MRENGSLNFYRNLMKREVPVDRNKTAPKCRQCCYYHPDFKYRKCLFSTCPYGKQDLDELEHKAGLIERKRQGLGKPNLIYVKSFYRTVDNSGERHFLKCESDISGSVRITL